MATFIAFGNFTEQGLRNIKKSPARAEAFKEMAKSHGVTVKDVFWTIGQYDIALVLEGTEESVTSALLSVSSQGNVRTQTLRAFSAEEMGGIIDKVS